MSSHEAPLVPIEIQVEKIIIDPAARMKLPAEVLAQPLLEPQLAKVDPEQVRVAEALFAAQQQEQNAVAGMFGLWMGTMLLNDVAVETFTKPAGEFEAEDARKKDHPHI